MGKYADRLGARLRGHAPKESPSRRHDAYVPPARTEERLICVAIMRDGQIHGIIERCFSHADLRRSLGDDDPYQRRAGDVEGFWTSAPRFVDRRQAAQIAYLAGQTAVEYHSLLSSEVRW